MREGSLGPDPSPAFLPRKWLLRKRWLDRGHRNPKKKVQGQNVPTLGMREDGREGRRREGRMGQRLPLMTSLGHLEQSEPLASGFVTWRIVAEGPTGGRMRAGNVAPFPDSFPTSCWVVGDSRQCHPGLEIQSPACSWPRGPSARSRSGRWRLLWGRRGDSALLRACVLGHTRGSWLCDEGWGPSGPLTSPVTDLCSPH